MENDIVLTMRGICKSFPGVKALNDVDFTLRKGTIHADQGADRNLPHGRRRNPH